VRTPIRQLDTFCENLDRVPPSADAWLGMHQEEWDVCRNIAEKRFAHRRARSHPLDCENWFREALIFENHEAPAPPTERCGALFLGSSGRAELTLRPSRGLQRRSTCRSNEVSRVDAERSWSNLYRNAALTVTICGRLDCRKPKLQRSDGQTGSSAALAQTAPFSCRMLRWAAS